MGIKWSLKEFEFTSQCSLHWDDPEGWYGEGRGGGFRMGTYVNFLMFYLFIKHLSS